MRHTGNRIGGSNPSLSATAQPTGASACACRARNYAAAAPAPAVAGDGSRAEWLSGEPQLDLIVTMDEATSTIYSAFRVEEEGTVSMFGRCWTYSPRMVDSRWTDIDGGGPQVIAKIATHDQSFQNGTNRS